jgi:hypothetical protein
MARNGHAEAVATGPLLGAREPRHHPPQFLQRATTTAPKDDDDDFDD